MKTKGSSFFHKDVKKEKNSELDPMETFVCSDVDGSGSFDVKTRGFVRMNFSVGKC